ncbi:hypothetical protein MN608_04492 [Microdochium nivale]|nr:hypothetical protein MN608_04492 [Microdochium nivale]
MSTTAIRRPHLPKPVLVFNDHHYPAISVHDDNDDSNNNNNDTSGSSKNKKPRRHGPAAQNPTTRATPSSRTVTLRAAQSPGLPVPSPLSGGHLPSPLLPLLSASSMSSVSTAAFSSSSSSSSFSYSPSSAK